MFQLTLSGCVSSIEKKNADIIETIHWYVLSFPKVIAKAKTMKTPPRMQITQITQARKRRNAGQERSCLI